MEQGGGEEGKGLEKEEERGRQRERDTHRPEETKRNELTAQKHKPDETRRTRRPSKVGLLMTDAKSTRGCFVVVHVYSRRRSRPFAIASPSTIQYLS